MLLQHFRFGDQQNRSLPLLVPTLCSGHFVALPPAASPFLVLGRQLKGESGEWAINLNIRHSSYAVLRGTLLVLVHFVAGVHTGDCVLAIRPARLVAARIADTLLPFALDGQLEAVLN